MYPLNPCLEPVVNHLDEILLLIDAVCKAKGLQYEEAFLFQSRAVGDCKPTSDIDVYLRLPKSYSPLVDAHGVLYKNTGVKMICGEWAVKFFEDLDRAIFNRLGELMLDLFFGVEEIPPAKDEYKGKNYFINLKEL